MNRTAFDTMLAALIKRAGSQAAAAAELGISTAYLSDVKNGRRAPGDKLLAALGLKRSIQYEKAS
jgi:DNA-binding transcriptional regulator YdaS (Cro superfamily)